MKNDQNCTQNIKALLVLTTAMLFFSSPAWSDVEDTLVLCKIDKTVRTLRIEMSEDKICKAIYTKRGVDQTIGSGQNPNSCVEFVEGVKKTLESAKWKCREVQAARTSSVAPVTE